MAETEDFPVDVVWPAGTDTVSWAERDREPGDIPVENPPHEHQWVLVPGYAVPQLPMAMIWVCQCGEAKVVEYEV